MAVETEEGWFFPDANTMLYTKTWKPPPGTNTAAIIAFVHGFSDHCNAYYDLFPSLAIRGIKVYAFDQRGWGRSAPHISQRGDSGPTATVLADIRSFLRHIAPEPKPLAGSLAPQCPPLFLMGHSMGGAEVLLLSLLQSQPRDIPKVSGILLESPFIALHPDAQPNAFTLMSGKLAARIFPKHQLVQKLEARYLCRNPQVSQDWLADELCHDTGTLEGLRGMMQRAADLTAFANGQPVHAVGSATVIGTDPSESRLVPVWIGHGTEDRVTSCPLSKALFDKLAVGDKTLKIYEGAFHKLHAEPDGVAEEFANDVATWILERKGAISPPGSEGSDGKAKL